MSHHHNHNKNFKHFSNLNEFEFLSELGKGGYSVVNLVRHIETGKKYALKCAMKIRKGKDRSNRTRQEIKILSKLKHSRIISLKGWFEDKDNIYLVLEYLPEGDLAHYFKNDLPSKEETINIMCQIIDAIKYCHRKGIVHRDIKLENILIDENMNIKLTDFGLSIFKKGDEKFNDEVGTPRYTAPEILTGEGYNEGVDIWGLGIILFLLLTGKYPFDGSTRKNIFTRIVEKRIDYSYYDLDSDEIHLLKRLLCKNPRYRIKLDAIEETSWFVTNSS